MYNLMTNVQSNDVSQQRHCYLYGASALTTAANSGSHLSPLASSFSLLYSSSSLVSVAYSAFGPCHISKSCNASQKEDAYLQQSHRPDNFLGKSRNRCILSYQYHIVLSFCYHLLAPLLRL